MVKKFAGFFYATLLLMNINSVVVAQAPEKAVQKTAIKFKPPTVQSRLGTASGNTAVLGAEEAKNLITLPLTVLGDKNVSYAITSYQFVYNRVGITEDEATGKAAPEKDMVSDHFNTTPLPAIWLSNIAETLHAGESLYFFDIIAIDKLGRRFFAPELRISIK